MRLHTLLSILLALFLMTGCQQTVDSTPVVQTYAVPEHAKSDILEAVNRVLTASEKKTVGQASLLPNNKLLVVAPEAIQQELAKVLQELQNLPAPKHNMLQSQYWVLQARPRTNEQASNTIPELNDALAAIEKAQGPLQFQLLERLEVTTVNGHRAEIKGRHAAIEQNLDWTETAVAGSLTVQNGRGELALNTDISLPPGKTLVLGMMASPSEPDTSLYYVARFTRSE